MLQEIRVVLIEEGRQMRDRLAAEIRLISDLNLILQTGSVEDVFLRVSSEPPDLILLDIDVLGNNPQKIIAELVTAYPDVGLICTSRRWDEVTARLAVLAGAKGYLIKPFTSEDLLEAIKAIDQPKLLPVSEIITLVGPKGGGGKTTLAVNLAAGLAELTGQRVGIVDGDIQFGAIDVLLNVSPVSSIVEAARDLKYLSPVTLGAYLTEYSKSIKMLAAARSPEHAELVQAEDVTGILARMRMLFRYIIVDTAPGVDKVAQAATAMSDYIYVIGETNCPGDIDHIRQTLEFFNKNKNMRGQLKVILSRANMNYGEAIQRMEDELECRIAAVLPNDFTMAVTGINSGVPLIKAKPLAPLSKAILCLARDIAGEQAKMKAAQ